ncbi:MAG: N-acetylmuramoyl-L-alanine amidase [Chromatiales bacterium]|nr:N-acetylmuramoyl-L-alanine amidase [Chromatiales bacterium]
MLLICLSVLLGPQLATAAEVRRVEIVQTGPDVRLNLDLSSTPRFQVFSLAGPNRIVIDIEGGRISPAALPLPRETGPVSQVRFARQSSGVLRVVFDLDRPLEFGSAVLPNGSSGSRMVISLRGAGQAAAPAPAAASPAGQASSPSIRRALDNGQGRDLVIVVDAGHGGTDPGAIGPSGILEKDITLAISRRIVALLDQEPGMSGELTRQGDYFVRLRDRMERARSVQADFFVSIHADAINNRQVRGSSVYALSTKGATDEAARRLAARENAADLIGGVQLSSKEHTLASVLMDLSQRAAISSSLEAGDAILNELARVGPLLRTSVQQAPFLVLKSPDVPSLLVETAFISNPQDERNLTSAQYQDRVARAVVAGIRRYFYENPPPGTLVASLSADGQRGPIEHVIRRGETLSALASRYNVSVREIRAANNLRGDRVVVGQVVRIPVQPGG